MKDDMTDDERETYLRQHTFNGARQELHDAWLALWQLVIHEMARDLRWLATFLERYFLEGD